MTNEEKIIKFLNNKFNSSETNAVSIGRNDVPQIDLTEQEIVRSLYILQEDGIIVIKRKTNHNDFSMFWEVALKSDCIHYFENKHKNQKHIIYEIIKFLIPTTISILALIFAA